MRIFAAMCWLVGMPACSPAAAPDDRQAEAPSAVRPVRVLVAADVQRLRARSDGGLSASFGDGTTRDFGTDGQWVNASPGASDGIRIDDRALKAKDVAVQPRSTGSVGLSVRTDGEWLPERRFPGVLRLTVGEDNRLDVTNVVPVEQYVASVVASEVWPTFEKEAYRVQAIAARTFVLFQMSRRSGAAYDVTATQRAQVYRGIRTDEPGRRARQATEYTRGIVLAHHHDGKDRLFCTYYSAACGGMSQSAAIFGPDNDIPPLSGGVSCDYCKIAPGRTYRWGPVRLAKNELWSRLVSDYPDLTSLERLRHVEVTERTPSGRPVFLRLTGANGATFDMLAERFRLAIGGSKIRSTDFELRVDADYVTFKNGRGFGHGLGLCQWGAQGQAIQGKRTAATLRYYYPGSKLMRAY